MLGAGGIQLFRAAAGDAGMMATLGAEVGTPGLGWEPGAAGGIVGFGAGTRGGGRALAVCGSAPAWAIGGSGPDVTLPNEI